MCLCAAGATQMCEFIFAFVLCVFMYVYVCCLDSRVVIMNHSQDQQLSKLLVSHLTNIRTYNPPAIHETKESS